MVVTTGAVGIGVVASGHIGHTTGIESHSNIASFVGVVTFNNVGESVSSSREVVGILVFVVSSFVDVVLA